MFSYKVENNLIVRKIDGDVSSNKDFKGFIVVEDMGNASVGDDIRKFNDDFSVKSIEEQIELGTIKLLNDEILENGRIKRLPMKDQAEKGLIEVPKGKKYDENNNLIDKAIDEQFIDKEITKDEYNNLKLNRLRQIRNFIISQTDWTQLPDITDKKKNPYIKYRKELRDLPSLIQIDSFKYDEIVPENTNIFPSL